ncbi:MAG: ribonuclease Z [Ignavibacteriaceae bacterium]|nr:ribonuclease Z [Ignavibacteriaceae bacterium]
MTEQIYPLQWKKKDFSIKIFCSIPNIATGILLKAGDSNFVIDPGDGILRDLNSELGVKKLLELSDVFITHGHHDHVGGVWSLLTYLRVMQKKSPLTIHYPEGCVEIESIYNAFKKVYSRSITYKINLKPIKKTNGFTTGNISVKPFPVIHKELLSNGKKRQVPALGYNFIYDNMKICYGGDTAYCDELVVHAKNADLAILEAGHDEETPDDMHLTKTEAVSIGKSAKKYF